MNKLNSKDVQFEYFKRSNSKGGQKQNKTSSAVRATHIPSGIVVESSKGRSQSDNKKIALEKLQNELDSIKQKAEDKKQSEAYWAKPDASFASQVRTYRLCGNNQGVNDHRTNITHPNTKAVLDGDLDDFIRGNLNVKSES